MIRPNGCIRVLACALAALATWLSLSAAVLRAESRPQFGEIAVLVPTTTDNESTDEQSPLMSLTDLQQPGADDAWTEELPPEVAFGNHYATGAWTWQWLPAGLIYRSYMAGVHEPRMAIVAFHEGNRRTLWDATLGGRVGFLRYGDFNPLRPQGFQLDFYGAAITRLDVENGQDQDSTDYVFGFPLTYGVGSTQYKFGYAHTSSHLGDELAIREPGALDDRVNYVKDSFVLGTSHFLYPLWRLYGEVGWAFHNSDGAQPWEGQFGAEVSRPGPTGRHGTPYIAVNGRLREEHDFGGDVGAQVGWLRRGEYGQTLRLGAQYYNGKSSQMQFFDQAEEQIGLGLWYDF